MYASSRILHRNLWIGARPENRQLAMTATLCIASGKPSTRFPLGWHVQKGCVLSYIQLICLSQTHYVGSSLIYWFGCELPELPEILDGSPKELMNIFWRSTCPRFIRNVLGTHYLVRSLIYRLEHKFLVISEISDFRQKYSTFSKNRTG